MFDLLFDASVRQHFLRDRAGALATYDLSAQALQDFETIRHGALELDARMRADLMLASISKVLPVSFSVVSSCEGGLELLRGLLDTRTMRAHPAERALTFATQLREQLHTLALEPTQEIHAVALLLDAERGMASTAAERKRAAVESGECSNPSPLLPAGWEVLPVQMAPFVSAGLLPQSYAGLKQCLNVTTGASLWRALNRSPTPEAARYKALAHVDPRLLVARAWVSQPSVCDPVVEHQTLELPEGFAALFQYVNGTLSIDGILVGLAEAGAPTAILDGVRSGFRQLLETGMLTLVA